jgi:hypothetical protein
MTATLRYHTPRVGVRCLIVDCPHGTTHATTLVDGEVLTEALVVRMAIAKHEDEEHCGCARGLDTLASLKPRARS